MRDVYPKTFWDAVRKHNLLVIGQGTTIKAKRQLDDSCEGVIHIDLNGQTSYRLAEELCGGKR